MSEARYMISETAKKVDVETHVLRYWEEELELPIGRTELGHRYYTEEDIHVFRSIKELKERGFQLKAIKVLLPEIRKKGMKNMDNIICLEEKISQRNQEKQPEETQEPLLPQEKVLEPLSEGEVQLDKLQQFEMIVGGLFRQILQENNMELEQGITDTLVKEMDALMQLREEREEERYRKLDETIRAHQKNRQMVAATGEKVHKKKKKWNLFSR